jgi:hypothetical protein
MADKIPRRLYALQKLTEQLQTITPANGYTCDLSTSVFRGRAVFGASDPVPMLSILESPKPDDPMYVGYNMEVAATVLPLLLQGWQVDDFDNPTDPLYWLLADVETCLGRIIALSPKTGQPLYPDEYMLGMIPGTNERVISELSFTPGIVRPGSDGVSNKAFFWLPVSVSLDYDMTTPYIEI